MKFCSGPNDEKPDGGVQNDVATPVADYTLRSFKKVSPPG